MEVRVLELKITHYVESGIPVMKLEGDVRIGDSSAALRLAVREYLSKGTKKLIIELAHVYYTDSSGIGEIFASFTEAHKAGCIVVYAGLSPKVVDLLTITNLLTVLDVYPSAAEAASRIAHLSFSDWHENE